MSMNDLYEAAGIKNAIINPNIAHLILDGNEVKGTNMVHGLNVKTEETEKGAKIKLTVEEGNIIEKPVHMCFGMSNREGVQKIDMEINVEDNSKINILSHCVFPDATDVKHLMNSVVNVGKNAEYMYLEKHIHSEEGEIEVVPEAEVFLDEGAKFETDFELLKGRVGKIDIKYKTVGGKDSVTKMTAKIDGKMDDKIDIKEICHLNGEGSRGVLETRVAARDKTEANVYNEMIANAAKAKGHVDCKEIVKDDGEAKAVPVVQVNHPKAHVTHEAAIGSVDRKQLETLMSRGLSEEEGTDLIIKGLLNG
ncbi:MAG: SufD family Fe-S cluster assembly protein [Candidatus Aenigmatarchaeota archaeon]